MQFRGDQCEIGISSEAVWQWFAGWAQLHWYLNESCKNRLRITRKRGKCEGVNAPVRQPETQAIPVAQFQQNGTGRQDLIVEIIACAGTTN